MGGELLRPRRRSRLNEQQPLGERALLRAPGRAALPIAMLSSPITIIGFISLFLSVISFTENSLVDVDVDLWRYGTEIHLEEDSRGYRVRLPIHNTSVIADEGLSLCVAFLHR